MMRMITSQTNKDGEQVSDSTKLKRFSEFMSKYQMKEKQ
jgi:hypothetical protein